MNYTKKYPFLILVCLFILAGCKKDSTNLNDCPSDGSSNFSFLKVGHQINYYVDYSFYGEDTLTYNIASNPSVGGYMVQTSSKNGKATSLTQSFYYHACSMDIYTSQNGNYNQFNNYWFSLDANVGDTWSRQSGTDIYTYRLIAKNVSVTTPYEGQTFTNCYKFTFHEEGTVNTDTIYFKPDAGVVNYEGLLINYEMISKNF